MSRAIVEVTNLSKTYRLGSIGARTLREGIAAVVDRMQRRAPPDDRREFQALSDVSFQVQPGEVLGIIGRNGAGKSTLLKILSRITEPSAGEAILRGRIASLLEVGTGFHPELTGRENIFLNGAILGMTRAEIRGAFDAIVGFAEVERFIDTPVKRYSSGMYVRLAFAIAAHLEPEILIVDEVLAVGDASFQARCLGKMGDAARQGRTILFVSHNMAAVERLCDRVLVLERGSVRFTGTAEDAVRQYLQLNEATKVTWARADDHPISHPHFTRAWLTGANGDKAAAVTSAAKLGIAVEFRIPQRVPALHLAVAVCNEEKIPIFATVPEDSRLECPRAEGLYRTCVWLPQGLLMPRRYHIVLSLYMPGEPFDQIPAALTFEVAEVASLYNLIPGGRVGEVQIVCSWEPFAPLNTGNMA